MRNNISTEKAPAAMNAVYAEFFPDNKPARVCFQAAVLPKNSLIEIDAIAGK